MCAFRMARLEKELHEMICNRTRPEGSLDPGSRFHVMNVPEAARNTTDFRRAVWTGQHLQMTLMSIPVRGDVGAEMHPDVDQLLRVEAGQALVRSGNCQNDFSNAKMLQPGDVVFVPAGTWHNVENCGGCALQLSSVYAPPQHPRGIVHRAKAEAE